MVPLSVLLELCEYACAPWGGYGLQPATPESVERISLELGVVIPAELVAVSQQCPSYGSWFAGLGEDYQHGYHILNVNAGLRAPSDSDSWLLLPDHLVAFSHGHDGDCDCWDRSEQRDGEHPICYVGLDQEALHVEHRFSGFMEYLVDYCSWPRTWSRSSKVRRRVRAILREYPTLRER